MRFLAPKNKKKTKFGRPLYDSSFGSQDAVRGATEWARFAFKSSNSILAGVGVRDLQCSAKTNS